MHSAIRRTRRFLAAAVVGVVTAASLLVAAPAQAYDVPTFEVPNASQAPVPYINRAVDAAGVVELWKMGGPATRAAAAAALVGGADALQEFLDAGQDVTLAADRKQLVTELTERGSEEVRASAQRILAKNDPAIIDSFLAEGWAKAWDLDLRITATRFLNYSGPIRTGASNSLDKGTEAVEQFVLEGWRKTAQGEDRVAVTYLTGSPVPAVTRGAQAALDTNDPQAIADFLRYGQFVAADHHTESAAVTALLEQVKADIKANPLGTAAVADRARTAVEQAKGTAAAARKADTSRLVADRDILSKRATQELLVDNVSVVAAKPFKEAFAKAAKELPGLLTTVSASGADLDALSREARQARWIWHWWGRPRSKRRPRLPCWAATPP